MNKVPNSGPFFLIVFLLLIASLSSCSQDRQEKTSAIFEKLNLVENQKTHFEFRMDPLQYQAIGSDSVKLAQIESLLTEDEITKRLNAAFEEVFNDHEINDLYIFINSSAFEKFFNSDGTNRIISEKFMDIDSELQRIENSVYSNSVYSIDDIPATTFEPIPVPGKENGFYSAVDYSPSIDNTDIKLEESPSLTTKAILEVLKVYASYNDEPEISILLTKDGARKFQLLTKENIGNPIAIVIGEHIVSMPIVSEEIVGGKISISGNYSEEEIDKMIKKLKGK